MFILVRIVGFMWFWGRNGWIFMVQSEGNPQTIHARQFLIYFPCNSMESPLPLQCLEVKCNRKSQIQPMLVFPLVIAALILFLYNLYSSWHCFDKALRAHLGVPRKPQKNHFKNFLLNLLTCIPDPVSKTPTRY